MAPRNFKAILTFGKYVGSHISEVPRSYLEWIIRESNVGSEALRKEISEYLHVPYVKNNGSKPPKKGKWKARRSKFVAHS
jgi:uncharacterized protein (DUF3820 family)